MTETQFEGLNFVKGTCTVTNGNVVLDAVTAKTCNFACKEGHVHSKGVTNIAFTCAYDADKTKAEGSSNWGTIGECQGACLR